MRCQCWYSQLRTVELLSALRRLQLGQPPLPAPSVSCCCCCNIWAEWHHLTIPLNSTRKMQCLSNKYKIQNTKCPRRTIDGVCSFCDAEMHLPIAASKWGMSLAQQRGIYNKYTIYAVDIHTIYIYIDAYVPDRKSLVLGIGEIEKRVWKCVRTQLQMVFFNSRWLSRTERERGV